MAGGSGEQSRILVVDDEIHILNMLEFLLTDEGFSVCAVKSGEEALERVANQNIDLIILDLTLPGIDGFEVCRRLSGTNIPILILSSHDEDEYVIAGLETGALDYVRKPFNHTELILRVGKLIKRTASPSTVRFLSSRELKMDMEIEQITLNGRSVRLTPTEYQLLLLLMRRNGSVVGWDEILHEVWGAEEWEGARELIKVNVRRLRQKIEMDPHRPMLIVSQWGRGYRFAQDVTAS